MGVVLVQCPRTGRYISTGVETDNNGFNLLIERPKTVQCPCCRKEHVWTKRNAMLVDPAKWSEVPEIQNCFLKAIENSEHAAATKRADDREFYLRMERKWLKLADGFRGMPDLERRQGLSAGAALRELPALLDSCPLDFSPAATR